MEGYNKLVKDFFKKINPLNPLHYYGYRHIVIGGEAEKSERPHKLRE